MCATVPGSGWYGVNVYTKMSICIYIPIEVLYTCTCL